jgi:hypothetical protein
MRYSITYSSPFFYLYNENTNKLIMKNRDQALVTTIKKWLDKIEFLKGLKTSNEV